ncbi:MAG: DUF2306 domain-containing protein [Pseudohongiellaceae bacterium]
MHLVNSSMIPNSIAIFRASSRALLLTVWASSLLFGLYILANYAAAFFQDDLLRWNNVLPEIYDPDQPNASVGIGLHFAAGGIILVLGAVQMIGAIRSSYPRLHHWIGRFYVLLSIIVSVGGLSFIAIKGTVGGLVMDVGFGLYGILMLLAALQTVRYAMARNLLDHQAWAWRLYALAIGSWLYRMDYGLWLILTDWAGHTDEFDGWFDHLMAFFFYIPNLIIVELMVRSRSQQSSARLRNAASFTMISASILLIVATWGFARVAWLPAIATFLSS